MNFLFYEIYENIPSTFFLIINIIITIIISSTTYPSPSLPPSLSHHLKKKQLMLSVSAHYNL